ncbi:hypothetical protein [Puerhibacterium puerhi]|uniref:hypothetical protein n=1 Tax=Puerhibacterium puerhi TaxID=2692623 RepID=UPI0013592E87|nr:hypothetical protein [Puerhibacterium puerhi]
MSWLVAVGVIVLVGVLVNVIMRAQARRLEARVRAARPGWTVRRGHVTAELKSALAADGVYRTELRNLAGSDLVVAAGPDGLELWCPPGKEPLLRCGWRDVAAVTDGPATTWEFTQVPAVRVHTRHGVAIPLVLADGRKRHTWVDEDEVAAVVARLRALRDAQEAQG